MQQTQPMLETIQNFNLLPKDSLEKLGRRLGLRMSLPELLFCARHYQNAPNGEIALSTLRFLDALACPAYPELAKLAVHEYVTEHACLAEAFASAVDSLKAHGKDPKTPYTLQDFATLTSNSSRVTGSAAHRAAYGDALVLLDAPKGTENACPVLPTELEALVRCACDCSTVSPARAILQLCQGAVLELSRMPAHKQDALSLTEYRAAWLLTLPQDALSALLQKAGELDLHATLLGVVSERGVLEIRCNRQVLLSLDTGYLRSLCFIRAYNLQADREDVFAMAQLRATRAFAQAVADGCDPAQVTVQAHLQADAQRPTSLLAADMLCMLLGLYRFSDAAGVAVLTDARFGCSETQLHLKASAPVGKPVHNALQGQGKLYLLAPHTQADGLPDLKELRMLCDNLHQALLAGKIHSLLLLCDTTPAQLLAKQDCDVIQNPHAAQALARSYPCAFLAETDFAPDGELIAITTLPNQQKCMDNLDNIQ